MQKKISVIIPIYNSEKYIDRCITSIIDQSYNELDIILINDGSKDKSLEICNKYKEKDKRIRVFDKENSGVSDTRNFGIKKSIGEYITFVDSDDYIDKDFIKNLINNVENNAYVRITNLSYSEEKVKNSKIYTVDNYIEKALNGKFIMSVCGGIYKKELLGTFDKNTYYMEDAIFLTEYLQKCSKVKLIVSTSKYNYISNPESVTNKKHNALNNIKSFFYSLDKINTITNFKFDHLISNKKFILLEKECRFVDSFKEYKYIKNNEDVKKVLTNNKSKKKIVFSNYLFFRIYYSIRKIIKTVYQIIKK